MGTYTYLHTYRFISDALRRCPLLWINRLGWISFGRWFSSIDTFIDLFTTRFWKSIFGKLSRKRRTTFQTWSCERQIWYPWGSKINYENRHTRLFEAGARFLWLVHKNFVNAGIYIKNLFYLFYRKQRIVKIASIDRIAASDTFWHIMWLGGVK